MNSTRGLKIVLSGAIERTVENLDIAVDMEKSLSSIPNQAIVKIYNLKEETRIRLQGLTYDINSLSDVISVSIFLKEKLLFKGQLVNSNTILNVNEASFETTLWCGDGVAMNFATTNTKFEKGSTNEDITNILISELESYGISKGSINKLKDCTGGRSLAKAITINGNIVENIKKLLNDCVGDTKNDVFVDNGKINIKQDSQAITDDIKVLQKGFLEPPALNDTGVSAKMLIDTDILIGTKIKIESESKNVAIGNLTVYKQSSKKIQGEGIYQVTKTKYNIDNFSPNVASVTIEGLIV